VLTGLPAEAQTWHRVYIIEEIGPAPAPYYPSEGRCHTVVYPDGVSYSTCNSATYARVPSKQAST